MEKQRSRRRSPLFARWFSLANLNTTLNHRLPAGGDVDAGGLF